MKEVYINNIKIAKKLEDLGLYNEADKIDKINLVISRKLVLSQNPDFDPMGGAQRMVDREFNMGDFVEGLEKGAEKVSNKNIDIVSKLPLGLMAKANTFFSKIFGYGGIAYGAYSFFTSMAKDPSGKFGDSPRDKALIVSNISQVISGIGMISAASGSGTVGVFMAFAAAIVQVLSSIIAEYLEDDYDYGKKPYSPKELVDDALLAEFDERTKPFDKINPNMFTPSILKSLKARITLIGAKQNIRTQDVQAAHAIVDKITNANPKSKDVIYQEMKNKTKPSSKTIPKEIPKDMRGFDVPFTP